MALLSLKVTTAVTPAGGSAAATTTVKSAAVSVAAPITLGIQQNFVLGPPGVGPQWKGLYSSGTTYAQGDGVTGSNGHNYISLVSSNLNHDPTTDAGVHWADTLPPSVVSTTSPKFGTVILTPSGGDDSVAMQTALNAGGTIIMGPGMFLWNTSVPAIARSTPTQIIGAGKGVTVVRGSSSASRFVDCPRVSADFETYSDIEIRGVTFDRQNITQATNTHILVGNLIGGAWSLRSNFARIKIRDCQTLNVPTGTAGNGGPSYQNVSFVSRHLASAEATQTSCTSISVEHCDFTHGGNIGVAVMGTGATPVNVFYDDIRIWGVRHDTLNIPTAFHGDSNFQVGGTGFGGSVTIGGKCYGAGSGDVGIEIDDPLTCVVDDVQLVDFWNAGFFPNNFGGQTDVNAQLFTFSKCISRKVNLGVGATSSNGFRMGGTGGVNSLLGTVQMIACQHENLSQSLVPGDALAVSPTNPTAGYKKLIIKGFQVSISGYNQNVTTIARIAAVQTAAPSGTTLIEQISDLDVNFNVTRGAGSTTSLFIHAYACRGTGTILHNVDGITGSLTQANAVGTSTQLLTFGLDTDIGVHRGIFRRIGTHSVSGDGSPIGIRFGTSNTYGVLLICDSDLSGASAGSEFNFASAGDSAKVRCARVRRRNGVVPAPTTLTGLVTATGKALGTIHSCTVDIAPATGAGITVIEYSTDGGTTYTQVLNQAAGATPANVAINFGPLTTDSLIRVTFATTQPTINLVPFEP